MKCLNCGYVNDHYLCDSCTNPEILDKIFNEIRKYNRPDECENPYLIEFVSGLTEKYEERKIIPDILEQFDAAVSEYYYCIYYRMIKDSRFEEAAITYLQNHDLLDLKSQYIMYQLIENYLPNDFVKPKKWCELVAESGEFSIELYVSAAKYFAMIGEYDLSDALVDKGMTLCGNADEKNFIFSNAENMSAKLNKQKEDTLRYRTKKPYWPATEERRRAIALFYDEKGIKYPRIENRPTKVPESEFSPISECFDDELTDYCTFWCNETYSSSTVKCIYQIGAVKIRDNQIVDAFDSFIRPWDASSYARKRAAEEVSVSLEIIESAEDVDLVMLKFFAFVGQDVLVSTGALGNQAKLISRAARYTGMKEIQNEFYDILDLAADVSEEFDFSNNTREYLLSHFAIKEGSTALEKAQINKQLYDTLLNYGG